jgi:hypothetical protein
MERGVVCAGGGAPAVARQRRHGTCTHGSNATDALNVEPSCERKKMSSTEISSPSPPPPPPPPSPSPPPPAAGSALGSMFST